MSSEFSTPQAHARHDLETVMALRSHLSLTAVGSSSPYELNFTASADQMRLAQNFRDRQNQQSRARRALSTSDRLYRRRIEIAYHDGEILRLYLSPSGEAFESIEANSGDILVSWAAPQFLSLRSARIGDKCKVGHGGNAPLVEILSATEISREEPQALIDFNVDDQLGHGHFVEVRLDPSNGRISFREQTATVADNEVVAEVEIPQATSLGLGTLVHDAKGRVREIQFALDPIQWAALTAHHDQGTIVLTGPPGAGKTTVALLRATALINAAFADLVKQRDDGQSAGSRFLQRNSFRVVVVTENLRNYLQGTMASSEVAIPEAEVVNIRGAFLETFVRHRTLQLWIEGTRFRLAAKTSRVSDELYFIKAMPQTLRLCFYHALLNARENAGTDCEELIQRVHDAVAIKLEKEVLNRVLNEHDLDRLKQSEQQEDFDLDSFLAKIAKGEEFNSQISSRIQRLQALERQLQSFLQRWIKKTSTAVEKAIESDAESILVPGNDDLLLANFVEELSFPEQGTGMRKMFITESWRELVRLVNPRQILLRVIEDFEKTADRRSLLGAGLTDEHVVNALNEWRSTLSGTDNSMMEEDEESDDSAWLEDIDVEDEPKTKEPPKGAFTRSDFPLLASMARIFLAKPEKAMGDSEPFKRVGFLLPDDKVRYDHVIVDEGQDFTYSEIHLVRSLVETSRSAVTVCGDPFQRMDWRSGFSSLETVLPGADREFRIERNYRQTQELCTWVGTLGRCLFGADAITMESSDVHGPSPVVRIVQEMKEVVPVAAISIAGWFDEDRNPFSAVLAIGFDSGTQTRFTNSVRKRLEENEANVVIEKVADGRLIERGRVNVCEVPTVKGLEFDSVLVWVSKTACELLSQSSPQARVTKNMLYVACSRAKRNLTVVFQGEVPSLVGTISTSVVGRCCTVRRI